MDESMYKTFLKPAKNGFNKKALALASSEYLAGLFTRQADERRFEDLKTSFIKDGLKGYSSYPKDLEATAILFEGWEPY